MVTTLSDNAYTYDSTTLREDFQNTIYFTTPLDYPLHNFMKVRTVTQPYHTWQMHRVRKPTAVTAIQQGAEPTVDMETRVRAANQTMIVSQAWKVTRTERQSNEAGVPDLYAYQEALATLEVMNKMEFNAHFSEYHEGSRGAAPRMAGVIEWLHATGIDSADAVIAGRTIPNEYSATWEHDASADDLTETEFQNLLRDAHIGGLDVNGTVLFVPAVGKQVISNFSLVYGGTTETPLSRWNMSAENRTRTVVTDWYATNSGTVAVVQDRYLDSSFSTQYLTPGTSSNVFNTLQANQLFFGLDPTYWALKVLCPPTASPLAKSDDSDKGFVVYEASIECGNPAGAGCGFSGAFA